MAIICKYIYIYIYIYVKLYKVGNFLVFQMILQNLHKLISYYIKAYTRMQTFHNTIDREISLTSDVYHVDSHTWQWPMTCDLWPWPTCGLALIDGDIQVDELAVWAVAHSHVSHPVGYGDTPAVCTTHGDGPTYTHTSNSDTMVLFLNCLLHRVIKISQPLLTREWPKRQ